MPILMNIATYNGFYVQAQNGGGAGINCKGPWPREWETFWALSPDRAPEFFVHGAQIQFQTPSGFFVHAENGGGAGLNCSSRCAYESETFTIEVLSPSHRQHVLCNSPGLAVFLRTASGHYCEVDDTTGAVVARNRKVGEGGLFTFEFLETPPLVLRLKAPDGKHYVQADGGGGGEVTAKATSPQQWETFSLLRRDWCLPVDVPSAARGLQSPPIVCGEWVCLRTENGYFIDSNSDTAGATVGAYWAFPRGMTLFEAPPPQHPKTLQDLKNLKPGKVQGMKALTESVWRTLRRLYNRPAYALTPGASTQIALWTAGGALTAAGGGGGKLTAESNLDGNQRFTAEVSEPPAVPIPQVAQAASSAIALKYGQVGGSGGGLGYPLTGAWCAPDGIGGRQRFQNGAIYWHPDVGAHFIIGHIASKYERMGAQESEIGYPVSDPSIQEGICESQRFQKGLVIWNYSTGIHVVAGDIAKKYEQIGGPQSELGYPLSDRGEMVIGGRLADCQHFQGGTIYRIDQTTRAVSADGAILPRAPYRLSLDRVICETETPGAGSDDFWLSLVVSAALDLQRGEKTSTHRWRNGDVDSGESFSPNHTLYQGWLPEALIISCLGLEVDGTDAAADSLNKFEEGIKAFDKDWYFSQNDRQNAGTAIAASTVAGGYLGSAVAGGTATATAGSAAGGGAVIVFTGAAAVGAVVGLAAGIVVVAIIDFLPPELLLVDRRLVSGYGIQEASQLQQPIDPDRGIYLDLSFTRDTNGDLLEHRRYCSNSEGSVYKLVLRHHIG